MTTKATRTSYARSYRRTGGGIDSRKAHSRRQTLAVRWVKENHPDVYDELLVQAYAETGGERRRAGRPSGAD